VNLREGDELVSAMLADPGDDIILVSRQGLSLRFTADDDTLRPMGRDTSGVKGMTFREGDALLSASVIPAGVDPSDQFVFVVTQGGYAKRTAVDQYRVQGRGGKGIKVAKLNDDRGELAGALIVSEHDEVLVVLAGGKVIRSAVDEVPAKGRDTMGVVFARVEGRDRVISVARNEERALDEADVGETADAVRDDAADASAPAQQ
jgi:DNA gyrase subunit A